MSHETTVDISLGSILRVLLWAGGAFTLWYFRDILVLLLVAVVLAAAIDPTINRLERLHIPRIIALLAVFALLSGAIIFIGATFAPFVLEEIRQMIINIPSIVQKIMDHVPAWRADAGQAANFSQSLVNGLIQSLPGVFTGFIRGAQQVVSIITVFFLVYFFTRRAGGMEDMATSFVPWHHRPYVTRLFRRIEDRLGRWLRGQLTVGGVIALVVGIGLSLLHVKYAIVLALFAGFAELIPMIGPYIGMAPAVLIGLSQSPWTALWVFLLFWAVQQSENNFLTPRIMAQAVGHKPITVLLAILVGAAVNGITGIILAVPTLLILSTFLDDFRARRASKTVADSVPAA